VRSGREAPSPALSAHWALAKPDGRRWRTLGSGPPDRAGHLRQPVQVTDTGRVYGAWRRAAGGIGSVAGGFAATIVGRCHRIIHRRGDARGARSVSGGSASDPGSVLLR
jgi:hypothetical protein